MLLIQIRVELGIITVKRWFHIRQNSWNSQTRIPLPYVPELISMEIGNKITQKNPPYSLNVWSNKSRIFWNYILGLFLVYYRYPYIFKRKRNNTKSATFAHKNFFTSIDMEENFPFQTLKYPFLFVISKSVISDSSIACVLLKCYFSS